MANSFEKAVQVWNLTWDADWITSVCFLGSERRLVAGNNLGEILSWDLPEKPGMTPPSPTKRLTGHTNSISKLLTTTDGRWLISASYDHTIRYWDMQTEAKGSEALVLNARAIADAESRKRNGAKVPPPIHATLASRPSTKTLELHREWICALSLSQNQKTLVSGDDSGEVIFSERETGKLLHRWKVKGWVQSLALSPDEKQVFVSERIPLVFDTGRYTASKIRDALTGEVKVDLAPLLKTSWIIAADYSADGKILAISKGGEGDQGKTYLLEAGTGKLLRELGGHRYGATDQCFHPDGEHLLTTGRDTTIRIWKISDGKMVKELGKPRGGQFTDWIHALSLSPDGRWLAAADMAGAVQVWDLGLVEK